MARDRTLQNTGPTSRTVREHVKTLRTGRGLSLAALCARMGELGRPMAVSSLSEIENGNRRVDVDDLVTIAVALGVSPIRLLMPDEDDPDKPVTATGLGSVDANVYWEWLIGEDVPVGTTSGRIWPNKLGAARLRAKSQFQLDSRPAFTIREPAPKEEQTDGDD